MAKFKVEMPEDFIHKIEGLRNNYDHVVSEVLQEGVKPLETEVEKSLKSAIGKNTKHPSESTGDLLDSLATTKPYQNSDGDWNIKVGCVGYDRKGVPNPLKAEVLDKGRSNQKASPWSKPAARKAKKSCVQKMQEALEREIDRL